MTKSNLHKIILAYFWSLGILHGEVKNMQEFDYVAVFTCNHKAESIESIVVYKQHQNLSLDEIFSSIRSSLFSDVFKKKPDLHKKILVLMKFNKDERRILLIILKNDEFIYNASAVTLPEMQKKFPLFENVDIGSITNFSKKSYSNRKRHK